MTAEHITSSTRFAIDPSAAARMDTDELRANFHIGDLFQPGRVSLTYTHYDRMIVGGAVPLDAELTLEAIRPTGTSTFLERREIVAINLGGDGSVSTKAGRMKLAKRGMIYAGMGEEISFASDDAADPARFYLLSAPAHHAYPTRAIEIGDAKRLDLGSQATCNERSIFQFIHPDGVKTCQLVAGMTKIAEGSVWNTMPPHVHDRRMEVYLYFGLDESARVFHLLGEPTKTRHLLMANEEAALSPPWSIHAGVGTASYWFIWAMAGDNVDYTDVDPVPVKTLL